MKEEIFDGELNIKVRVTAPDHEKARKRIVSAIRAKLNDRTADLNITLCGTIEEAQFENTK